MHTLHHLSTALISLALQLPVQARRMQVLNALLSAQRMLPRIQFASDVVVADADLCSFSM